jgi:uncharacterized protein with von Willebrand factor type A (vWA) domain
MLYRREGLLAVLNRYSRWDGSQSEAYSAEDLMEHLADELLDQRSLETALRRFLQHGAEFPSGRRAMGLRELLERMRGSRQQRLQQYNLAASLEDIRQQLEQVIGTERRGIQRRLGQDGESEDPPAPGSTDPMFRELLEKLARDRLGQLDQLPADSAGRIQALRDYDFLDPGARELFQSLLKSLQEQVLQSTFQGLRQGIQSLTPEAMDQIRQLAHDLNRLLDQRMAGQHPDIADFMAKWGQFFPDGIRDIDQLAEHLRQQMAQMQGLLNAMSPEMRRELEGLLESVFQDQALQHELGRLGAAMHQLFPGFDQTGADEKFFGEESVSLQDALKLMGEMDEIGRVESSLLEAVQSNDASDVDSDAIGRVLGQEARKMTQQLQQLTRMLEEAGFIQIQRGERKRWELTPLAARKIGDKALREIFGRLRESGLLGRHALQLRGNGVDRLEETKPYAFGDPLSVDVQRTVMNAVRREGRGTPVHLTSDDFEVYDNEQQTTCSTVIMLDMSMSMMGPSFRAGQKVALALDSLIRTQYPRDTLHVAAFSYFVLPLEPRMLLDTAWVENGGGTNFQEALRQARLLLTPRKRGTRQIILITDGEPTTYYGRWRRGDETAEEADDLGGLGETLREVGRCTRERITINVFMIDRHHSAAESAFVRAMLRLNKGRAFFASADQVGEYILLDYLADKRRRAYLR